MIVLTDVATPKPSNNYGSNSASNYNSDPCATLPCPLGFSCLNLQGGQYTCLATSSDSSSDSATTASPSSNGLGSVYVAMIAGSCSICDACMLLLTDLFYTAVACVCLVAVVVGAVVMRKQKRQSKASKPDEAWYQELSASTLEVANPLCT